MSVTVTTSSGPVQVSGTDWNIDGGILTVVDDSGGDVATFAAGDWTSVQANVVTP